MSIEPNKNQRIHIIGCVSMFRLTYNLDFKLPESCPANLPKLNYSWTNSELYTVKYVSVSLCVTHTHTVMLQPTLRLIGVCFIIIFFFFNKVSWQFMVDINLYGRSLIFTFIVFFKLLYSTLIN